MAHRRHKAAAIVTNDGSGLLVTGGRFPPPNVTEYVFPGEDSVIGMPIPYSRYSHCLVQLDFTTYMAIGGRVEDDSVTSTTTTFDVTSEVSVLGPELTSRRTNTHCGVLAAGADKVVIVAGGEEIYDVTDRIESWTIGSSIGNFTVLDSMLPYAIGGGATAVTPEQSSMIIVGGYYFEGNYYMYENSLTRISCSSASICQANKLESKLTIPRSSSVAMLVPDSLVNCTLKTL